MDKKKRNFFIAFFTICVFIFIGFGCAIYYFYFKTDNSVDTNVTEDNYRKIAVDTIEIENSNLNEFDEPILTIGDEEAKVNEIEEGIDIENKYVLVDNKIPYDGINIIQTYLEIYKDRCTEDKLWNVIIDENSFSMDGSYYVFDVYIKQHNSAVIHMRYDYLNKVYRITSDYFGVTIDP